MTGRKTLGEVRAELEAALGAGPAGDGEVAESLRRFLAAGRSCVPTTDPASHRNGGTTHVSGGTQPAATPPAGEH